MVPLRGFAEFGSFGVWFTSYIINVNKAESIHLWCGFKDLIYLPFVLVFEIQVMTNVRSNQKTSYIPRDILNMSEPDLIANQLVL